MSIKYLKEDLPVDWDGIELKPNYQLYDITFIGYESSNGSNHSYISKIKINDETKFNNFLELYISYIRIATDKEVIDCWRESKLEQLSEEHKNYILNNYPLDKQTTFIAFSLSRIISIGLDPQVIMNDPIMNGIMSVFNWVYQVVMPYFYMKEYEILNCNSLEQWNNISWDHAQFDTSNPNITMGVLMQSLFS